MPKFRVKGCFKENAEDVEFIIEATSYKDAERMANQKGILVSDVLTVEEQLQKQHETSVLLTTPPESKKKSKAKTIVIISIAAIFLFSCMLSTLIPAIVKVTSDSKNSSMNETVSSSSKLLVTFLEIPEDKSAEVKLKLDASLPIDKSWTRIPEGFEGHDSKLLYESLVSKLNGLFHKSQFDTQVIHDKKIRDAVQGEILGRLEIHDTLAFFCDRFYNTYNAETEEISWWINAVGQLKNLKWETHPLSKYWPDWARQPEFYNVEVVHNEKLKLKLENGRLRGIIRMDPKNAEQILYDLEAMVLGTIQFPYLDKGGDDIRLMSVGDLLEQTKYDDTVESDVVYTLPFRVSEIWIIRSDTGEVLLKEKQ